MRRTTRRLSSVSVLILVFSIISAVVSIIARWPAQFGGPGDPNNVAGEFVTRGTATAAPLFPILVVLVVFILLVPSRRWWGTLGAVGLCVLAVLMFIGAMGEALAPPTPDVPKAVLIGSGVVGVILAVLLLLSGIADLVDRWRMRGQSTTTRVR